MSLILQRLIEEYFCTIPVITAGGGQFVNRPRSAGNSSRLDFEARKKRS